MWNWNPEVSPNGVCIVGIGEFSYWEVCGSAFAFSYKWEENHHFFTSVCKAAMWSPNSHTCLTWEQITAPCRLSVAASFSASKWVTLSGNHCSVLWGIVCCKRDSISSHWSHSHVIPQQTRHSSLRPAPLSSCPCCDWSCLTQWQCWKGSLHKKGGSEWSSFKDLNAPKLWELLQLSLQY